MAQTIRAGLMARAPVRAFSPASFKAKPGYCDSVIAKEFLFSLAGKDALLRQAGAAPKPGGGLVMTDYVLPPAGRITPATSRSVTSTPSRTPEDVKRAACR